MKALRLLVVALGLAAIAQGLFAAEGVPDGTAGGFFDLAGLAPAIVPFSTEARALELAKSRRVVYFFAAEWCDLCRADLAEFKERVAELPADVSLVVVDFDTADSLRVKYGVPLQDVFIQVDGQGKRLALWVGGGIDALKRKIKK